MRISKTIARKVFFPIVTQLRLDYLAGKLQRNRNLILCFHGVSNAADFSVNNRHMPAETFDKLIRYLSRNYEIVSVEELFKPGDGSRKRRICITFDDGYLNNFTTALPILEKYQVPATFYIITQSIHDANFVLWADTMDLLVNASQGKPLTLNGHTFKRESGAYHCETLNAITLTNYLKQLGYEKYELLGALCDNESRFASVRAAHPEYWQLMDTESLQAFSRSPWVTIGSHTVWHLNLADTPIETVREELKRSREDLEQLLGKPVTSIAYPDGSYNRSVIDAAEACGYTEQLAVVFSDPQNDRKDQRIRPRISISNSTTHHSNIFRINTSFDKYGF